MGDPGTPPIAIVGMGCLFPGAATLDDFWRNVCNGVDAITDVPPGRWDPVFKDDALVGATESASRRRRPASVDRFYCQRGGFVDDVARFDPVAFGVMPLTVGFGEPDQFLCLAQAAAALADSGDAHERVAPARIGVIVGRGAYRTAGLARLDQRVNTAQQLVEALGALVPDLGAERLADVRAEFVRQLAPDRPEASIGLVPNLAASRIANRFDFQGPAFTVDAACASALVAVDHARHELATGRCDLVLAGATHHCHDTTLWSVFTQLEALSPSQQIRPFSRRADGILLSEGTGFLVLRRLADAERDGDRVYAVIRGTGLASDGRSASLMSPSPTGEMAAMEMAWRDASLDPATVGLVEAHGTGTPVGDETELDALRKVFGPLGAGQQRAGLGSVKSMIGHPLAATGVAGLAKAALAVHHGVLPPTLHADDPHPLVDETRFRLVTEAEPWARRGPRRAGVSAFGFGGINSHVVIEQHGAARHRPGRADPPRSATSTVADGTSAAPSGRRAAGSHAAAVTTLPAVLLLAGADATELGQRLHDWTVAQAAAGAWARPPSIAGVPDMPGPARLAVVDVTPRRIELARKVVAQGTPWRGRNGVWFEPRGLLHDGGQVAFLFPGVEPSFEPRVDDVVAHFGLHRLAAPLAAVPDPAMSALERQSRSMLVVGGLLHHVVTRLGIGAGMVAGLSLGEWSAGAAAGVVGADEVLHLLDTIRPGAIDMADTVFLALGCGADRATELVADLPGTEVSHDNCTHQSVVCGPPAEIAVVVARCRTGRLLAQELPFRSGFHSASFAPHLPTVEAAFADVALHPARTPWWSAATCLPYPDDPEGIRAVAAHHLVSPVRFRELTLALHRAGARVFVQVGVGTLTGLVDDTLAGLDAVTVAANTTKRSGLAQLCQVAAAVWVEGGQVDMEALAHPHPHPRPNPHDAPRGASTAAPRPAPLLDLGTRLIRGLTPLRPDTSAAGPEPPVPAEVAAAASATAVVTSAPVPDEDDHARRAPAAIERLVRFGLDTEPAWNDHALFRQRDGWPYADDRFPLVPMAGIIELLGETARELHPHLVPVAVEQVSAFRWLAVEPAVEVVVRADTVASEPTDPPGSVRVRTSIEGHARAVVVLAPRYPAPPVASPPGLVDERPPHLDADRFYADRHMFHGPAYRCVRQFRSVADNGGRAVLESRPAPGALLDNAAQVLGHWLMTRPDLGRAFLPTAAGRVELFGPVPAPGTLVDCTATVTHVDERVVEADLLMTVDERTWCRVRGWRSRFFFTDAAMLETVKWPERTGMSHERSGYTLLDERWADSATRELVMRCYMSRPERAAYERHHPLGQRAFLLGRMALKDAVRRWLWARGRGPLFPAEILVADDAGGRPVVRGPFHDDLRVDVAQLDGRAVAVVAEERDLGIDIEQVEPRLPSFEDLVLTPHEQKLVPPEGYDRDTWLTCVWAVKEAAAKAAGRGVGGRPKDIEIAEVHGTTARVGDRLVAFERLPGPARPRGEAASPDPNPDAQKEQIVAWTVSDR